MTAQDWQVVKAVILPSIMAGAALVSIMQRDMILALPALLLFLAGILWTIQLIAVCARRP